MKGGNKICAGNATTRPYHAYRSRVRMKLRECFGSPTHMQLARHTRPHTSLLTCLRLRRTGVSWSWLRSGFRGRKRGSFSASSVYQLSSESTMRLKSSSIAVTVEPAGKDS